MIPWAFAVVGMENTARKLGGRPDVKKHPEDPGFAVGGTVTVTTLPGENVIADVMGAGAAIGEGLAEDPGINRKLRSKPYWERNKRG